MTDNFDQHADHRQLTWRPSFMRNIVLESTCEPSSQQTSASRFLCWLWPGNITPTVMSWGESTEKPPKCWRHFRRPEEDDNDGDGGDRVQVQRALDDDDDGDGDGGDRIMLNDSRQREDGRFERRNDFCEDSTTETEIYSDRRSKTMLWVIKDNLDKKREER